MLISIGIKFKKVDKASIFGSSIENGVLNLWNSEKIDKKKALNAPPGLFFRYADLNLHRQLNETGVAFRIFDAPSGSIASGVPGSSSVPTSSLTFMNN